MPAPFNKVGFGGSNIEAKYIDETGSAANVVTEFRNLVQRDQVDAGVGYISSGNCLAVTPVAEELKAITVSTIAERLASSRKSRAPMCSASARIDDG